MGVNHPMVTSPDTGAETSQSGDTQPERTEELAYPLDRDDPRVQAAREAEQRAYEHYGLEFTEHFVDVPSLETRIRVAEVGRGSGPPVVMVPGGEGPGVIWLPLLPELREYTVYVMDRPGGGLSDGIDYRDYRVRTIAAASTAALFDHFDLNDAPLVGNSMGGLWSLRFALENPERVGALALLGTPALYPGTSAPFPMRLMSLPVVGKYVVSFMQTDDADEISELMDMMSVPEEVAEALPEPLEEVMYRMDNLPHFQRSWVSMMQRVVRLRGAAPEAAFTPDDLRNVRSPVLLIWGSEDPFGTVEQGRAGVEHFPDAEFHEVGVSHIPWFDDPDTCGNLISDFIDRHR